MGVHEYVWRHAAVELPALGCCVINRGWKRRFDDPIPLPRGRQLVTLQCADRLRREVRAQRTQSGRLPGALQG